MSEAQTADDEQTDDNSGPVEFDAIIQRSRIQKWLKALLAVHDEGRVTITPDGFESTIIGPANAAGVDTTLGVEGFESLTVDTPGEFGLDFSKIDEVLSSMSGSELVELSYDDSYKLTIEGETASYDASTVAIEELDEQTFGIDYDDVNSVSVVVGPDDIKEAIDLVSVADEKVHLGFNTETQKFFASGSGDSDDVLVQYGDETYKAANYTPPEENPNGINGAMEFDSMFTIDYIKKQLQPTESSVDLAVVIADTMPMVWRYTLDDCIQVKSLVAPRIPKSS